MKEKKMDVYKHPQSLKNPMVVSLSAVDLCTSPLHVDSEFFRELVPNLELLDWSIVAIAVDRLESNNLPVCIRTTEIRRMTGASDSDIDRSIKNLIDLNVLRIAKAIDETYFVSPVYFWKSATGTRTQYFDPKYIQHVENIPIRQTEFLSVSETETVKRKNIILERILEAEREAKEGRENEFKTWDI